MKVLHIAEVGGIGGVQKWVLELARAQKELGCQVSIMLPPKPMAEPPQLDDVEILEWDLNHVAAADFVHSHAVYGFANASLRRRRAGPTLIHTYLGTVVGIQLAMKRYRNLLGRGGLYLSKNILREFTGGQAAHGVIAVSQKVSEEIKKFYRIPTTKIAVIPGAATRRGVPSKSVSRKALSLDENVFTFLFVGRGDPVKDLNNVLVAFDEVERKHPEVSLVVTPSQPVPKSVISFDFDQEMMPILFGACDAFINSSVYDAYSLAVHEALGYGLPTIVSDMAGISRYCGHGLNALVVRREPAETYAARLASAMGHLIKHAPLRSHLASNAKSSFDSDWLSVARATLIVYESAQASRG